MSIIINKGDWDYKKLDEVCNINPSKKEVNIMKDDIEVSFLPMASVSNDGRLLESNIRQLGEVRKGYTYFQENDVLVAKITPSMENGKRWLAKNLHNKIGFGSTEFYVIRPKDEDILSEWIYNYISQESFRLNAEKNIVGTAGQKRIPKSYLKNLKVLIPNIKEQIILCNVVKYIDNLKRLKIRLNKINEKFLLSIFYKMFGDIMHNEKKWDIVELNNVISDIKYGTSIKSTYHNVNETPVLRIPNIVDGYINYNDLKYSNLNINEKNKYELNDGDILIIRTNGNKYYVGKSAVFHNEENTYAYASYLIRIRIDESIIKPDFLNTQLLMPGIRNQILINSRTSAGQYNINTKGIKSLKILLPPIEKQMKLILALNEYNYYIKNISESFNHIENLYNSLLNKIYKNNEDIIKINFEKYNKIRMEVLS